jgi:hypothetical protein
MKKTKEIWSLISFSGVMSKSREPPGSMYEAVIDASFRYTYLSVFSVMLFLSQSRPKKQPITGISRRKK